MDMKACDKMILAIIQDDSYQDVISELNESGFMLRSFIPVVDF